MFSENVYLGEERKENQLLSCIKMVSRLAGSGWESKNSLSSHAHILTEFTSCLSAKIIKTWLKGNDENSCHIRTDTSKYICSDVSSHARRRAFASIFGNVLREAKDNPNTVVVFSDDDDMLRSLNPFEHFSGKTTLLSQLSAIDSFDGKNKEDKEFIEVLLAKLQELKLENTDQSKADSQETEGSLE
eukprot:GHVP01001602.1.p1 GENE.GHVP01001602.1~~GHVP01001602.1.p1  ORF type:complete len:187 (+),score=32.90 GHVP01001602.1:194-754(+)